MEFKNARDADKWSDANWGHWKRIYHHPLSGRVFVGDFEDLPFSGSRWQEVSRLELARLAEVAA